MKLYTIVSLSLITLLISSQISSGNELIYGSSDWPPWVIESEGEIKNGIDVEIAKEIASNLNVKLKIIKCPWARCLIMLENGQIDITGSTLKTSDREKYLHYINPPYILQNSWVFYLPKGQGRLIQKHEDLYKFKYVGVVRGNKYVSLFDTDSKINTYPVTQEIQLLKMLDLGRVQTFISQETMGDYLIKNEGFQGMFDKADFRYSVESPVYFVLSKKSVYANQVSEFNQIMTQMQKAHQITAIIEKYTK